MDAEEPGTISTPVACKLLMISRQRLDQLAASGLITRVAPGRWRTVDLVQCYLRFLMDEGRRSSRAVTLSKLQQARTTELDLRLAREMAETVSVVEVRALAVEAIEAFKSPLGDLPRRCTGNPALRRKITAELADVFLRTSLRMEALLGGGGPA